MAKCLSIELSQSLIRVAEMEASGKKSRMRTCFYFPVPQGAVEDGLIRDTQTVGELLKKELVRRKIRTKNVVFVVASSRIASREVTLPFVKEKSIQNIIQANAADYFPIDVSKYVLSYNIIGIHTIEEDKTKQYQLHVYAAPKSISAAYQEMASVAGLNVAKIGYAGDSIYQAVKEEYASGIHVIAKIEERFTLLSIIRDGKLALQRNLNHGMDSAVEAVRMYPVFGNNLDFEGAMEVLGSRSCIRQHLDMDPMECEPEDTDDFVREARRDVTESLRYLTGNISRIMDYYVSRNQGAEFASISICGLGAGIRGLDRLLSNELGQHTEVITELRGISTSRDLGDFSMYLSLVGSVTSRVNLMEKVSRKKKEEKDSLRGAWLIFVLGSLSAAILAGSSVGIRMIQEKEQDYLRQRITEEEPIRVIYQAYKNAMLQYTKMELMYVYTNTPNEGLVDFIEEMEEKMPSNIVVEDFNSTGSQVSFSMRVTSKAEAANTLIQLRTFDSLLDVTTTGISEGEDGTISMSVICSYQMPSLLESAG